MASGALREIFGFFKVGVDTDDLDKADKKLDSFARKFEQAAKGFAAIFAVGAVGKFVKEQIDIGTQLFATAERLGTTTEQLQKFHFAGDQVGLGAEQMDTALQFLNKSLGKSEEGSKLTSKAFAKLGINAKDAHEQQLPLEDVLGQVAEGFVKLKDRGEKTAVATELFGRAGARLIPLLEQGKDGVAELTKEFAALGAGYSEDFIKKAKEGNIAIAKSKIAFDSLKSNIGSELIPVFTKMAEFVTKGIVAFKHWTDKTYEVRTAMMALAGAATIGAFTKLWNVLGLGTRPLMQTLGLFMRFALPAAALYGLYLIFNDIYTMIQGGDSYVGRLLDQLGGIGTKEVVINNIKTAFATLKVVGQDLFKVVQDVGTAFGVTFNDALPAVITAVFGSVKVLVAGIATLAVGLGQVVELAMAVGNLSDNDKVAAAKNMETYNQLGSGWMASMNAMFPDTDNGKGSSQKMLADINSGRTAQEARTNDPNLAHANVVTRPPALGGGAAPAPAAPGNIVQNITSHISVNGVKGPPNEVGSATAKGVADGHKKAMQHAQAATVGGS